MSYDLMVFVPAAPPAGSALHDAYRGTLELAMKHRLGFFDVGAEDGQAWLPDGASQYRIAHGIGSSSVWPGRSPV